MTLLDELQALDVSSITNAKASISVAVNTDDLSVLLEAGAAQRVLGDLGTAIDTAVTALENPEVLIAPLLEAFAAVLDEIGLDVDLGAYVDAVADAARVVADLVTTLSGEPNNVAFGGRSIGGALTLAANAFGDHGVGVSGELARFTSMVATFERGLPNDPSALLGPVFEVILPVPRGSIDAVAGWAAAMRGRLDQIVINPDLTSGLVLVLGDISAAAEANDEPGLRTALDRLVRVRANTVDQLAAAMRRVAGIVGGLDLAGGAAPIAALRAELASADDTVFDMLDGWREMLAGVRASFNAVDAAGAMTSFGQLLDTVEATARTTIDEGIGASVEAVRDWVRGLLREIPLRPLRAELSAAIADLARRIADADLAGPIDGVRAHLIELQELLAQADPAALVQQAVGELEAVVSDALDTVQAALGDITAAIEAVADDAADVLGRAMDGVQAFRVVVDTVVAQVDAADIVGAGREIGARLDELQQQVSELLSDAPLPEPLRDSITQLIETLESIDLDTAIGQPLREVTAGLQIPDDVAATVRAGLTRIADVTASLVPADVVAELEAVTGRLFDAIEQLDIASITSGVSGLLDDAAGVFESVNVAELVSPIGATFADLVAALDRVHPRVLLRPAIDLHRQLLDAVPVPDPETITARVASVTSQAGETVARVAAEPARQALGPGATMPSAGASSGGPAREEPPADLRPGDVVRLVGYLPAKVREAIAGLDAGAGAAFVDEISQTMLATAGGLRTVRDRVVNIGAAFDATLDAALAPVAAAQIDAQLALRAHPSMGVDIDASMTLVASAGPVALRGDIDGERELVHDRASSGGRALAGATADHLDVAADLLESLVPAGVFADVDAFLAALDPEPIAAEIDALFTDIVNAMPAFLADAGAQLGALEGRIRALLHDYSPGTLMQRFLVVLEVVGEELAMLDPGRLADELGEIHSEVKAAILAYDPVVLAADLDTSLSGMAAALRGLDPAGLMPDLSGIEAQVARVADLVPAQALAGIGSQLVAVGDELRSVDIGGMLDVVNLLAPNVIEGITTLIDVVRDEIVDLLKSIRYATGSASASVSIG